MVHAFPMILSPFPAKDAVNSPSLFSKKLKNKVNLNVGQALFIVRSFLIYSAFLMTFSCGSGGPSSGSDNKSSKKGMLQEKDRRTELQGRIKTLESKFKELQKPPEHLNDASKERWNKKVQQADSLLKHLDQKVRKLESGKKMTKVRIDRSLQRLGIQARSMQNALQKEEEKVKEHP